MNVFRSAPPPLLLFPCNHFSALSVMGRKKEPTSKRSSLSVIFCSLQSESADPRVQSCVKPFLLVSRITLNMFHSPPQNCTMAQYFSQPFPKPGRHFVTQLCTKLSHQKCCIYLSKPLYQPDYRTARPVSFVAHPSLVVHSVLTQCSPLLRAPFVSPVHHSKTYCWWRGKIRTVRPGCKVCCFVQRKLTLQAS